MKHKLRLRSLARSIAGHFGAKRDRNVHKSHSEKYYKQYFFTKPFCDGIEWIAGIERISKTDAANLLMKAGLSSYIGDKITEYLQDQRAAQQFHQRMRYNRFIRMLRQYAKEQGMDISKFI